LSNQTNSYGQILDAGKSRTKFSRDVKSLIRRYKSARKKSVKKQCRKELLEKYRVKLFTREEVKRYAFKEKEKGEKS